MTKNRYHRMRAQEIEAFQHAQDDYWYRPLVFGKNLFTYIAYVPPGGFMPPHGHEEDPYELSFFMLQGELEVMLDGDAFTVSPGDALRIEPTVSLGVRNNGSSVATFVLTFNPPPPIASIEALRERYAQRGGGVKSAAEIEALLDQRSS
jgi:quercetin dioxygenase-like cupin family protein